MSASTHLPAAFLSYPSEADEDGEVTWLRERLEKEVRLQTGQRDFQIFQDRRDLQWGDSWRDRIEEAIDGSTYLLPLIQPLFFTSDECCRELQRFAEREAQLGRNDLILPIYYISVPNMTERSDEPLKALVARRQYADWRKLRNEDAPARLRAVRGLAERLVQAISRAPRAKTATPTGGSAKTQTAPLVVARPVAPTSAAASTNKAARLDALIQLLLSLFSSEEFTRFLRFHADTADLCAELPGGTVSPAQLFHEAGVGLERRDLLTEDFFARLLAERPRRAREIERVQALFNDGA